MSTFQLSSKRDAEAALASLLLRDTKGVESIDVLDLQVCEDKCFGDGWVNVGKIQLYPELSMASAKDSTDDYQRVTAALRHGFFEWTIPTQERVVDQITAALPLPKKEFTESQKKKIPEATKTIVHIATRCGLANPVFDALTLGLMQFQRPVSIVVDTTAVLQGGLDFFARYVTPRARIKVPALVHMEILNLVERYFKQRRRGSYTPQTLLDHVCGLGGQRVLLRLETDQNVEFERPRLGADPLRGVISVGSDAEDKNLGLSKVQRSFADRLILETAIQHRDQVAPDHPVMLLTSDQGLARMALTEGVQPIFFDSNAVSVLFGETLSGINFAPFEGTASKFHSSGLINVLWEFAATFGAARLFDESSTSGFEVVAIGEDVVWQPYHSYEDLLWTRESATMSPAQVARRVKKDGGEVSGPEVGRKATANSGSAVQVREKRPVKRMGTYSFNLNSMLRLIAELSNSGTISDEAAMSVVKVSSASTYGEYYNFLVSGGFIKRRSGRLEKNESVEDLYAAINNADYEKMAELLAKVPSFRSFMEVLVVGEAIDGRASGLRKDSFRSYCNLAEVSCLGVRLVDMGIFGTPNNPGAAEFVKPALEAYEAVRAGENLALTGSWLEKLVSQFGIHPVHARQRLAEAHQGGYIRRFFEGSTPDTRFENRKLHILESDQGQASIRTTNLFHGEFLMSGRASVSIKLSIGDRS